MLCEDESSFQHKWPEMEPTVQRLLHQQTVSRDQWHTLFYHVHKVCLWDDAGARRIQDALQANILNYISDVQCRVMSHMDDIALLNAYIAEWQKFFSQCDFLPLPFHQLETSLQGKTGTSVTKRVDGPASVVRAMMLEAWNGSIFSSIRQRLQDSAMRLVEQERRGEAFDSALVVGVRESYVNLSADPADRLVIYRANFESAYIESTKQFYKIKAQQFLEQNGVQNYMQYASQKLKEETDRGNKYLEVSSNSGKLLHECCVEVLVTAFRETILAECPQMIRDNDTKRLHLMFNLMRHVPNGVQPMLVDLEKHIVTSGLADMLASADSITQDSELYVEKLLALFRGFSALVRSAFGDDPHFLTARDKAYQRVVDDTSVFRLELPGRRGALRGSYESRCPELLANYCDLLLRKTPLSKRLSADEVEAKLRDVLLVLKYVSQKDVFMRYHKTHLTRRLILETSQDSEKEENMVEWLREVGMPADYVNKLARMFQDLKVSEDLNWQLKKQLGQKRVKGAADNINVKILNGGAWQQPAERVPVSLPLELEDFIPEVEDFYRQSHSGRKLQWHHHMGNGTITFAAGSGRYDLEVTTFQAAVLFAWNRRPEQRLSFPALRLATELPDCDLRRTLGTLVSNPKMRRNVLLMEPVLQAKDFTDQTEFWINHDFAIVTKNGRVQRRGRVNLIGRLMLLSERAREADNEGIVALRVLRCQEALVKLMKARKTLHHTQIHSQLIQLLCQQFQPSKKLIKETLEFAMENKFVARDENDLNVFHYTA